MTPTPTSQPRWLCDGALSIIVAIARDGAIGRAGNQPFFITEDLKRFKRLTSGHAIIMGRKTFEALPKGALPNRRNIVVTRQSDWTAPSAERAASLDQAIAMARAGDNQPFIIGGGEIYNQAIDCADRLFVTEIDADVADADTYFPAIDPEQWRICEATNWITSDAPDSSATRQPPYRFVCYCRK